MKIKSVIITFSMTAPAETLFYPTPTIYERYPFLKPIADNGKLPTHVAIIMDGNRRWAKRELGPETKPIEGHTEGMNNIVGILRDLRQLEPIKYITLWAFSSDNWQRGDEEVADLMGLLTHAIPTFLPEIHEAGGRFVHLGRKDRIPEELRSVIEAAESETAQNTGQVVALGIDYGGQDQQLRIMQRFAEEYPMGTPATPDILRQLSDTYLADGTEIPPVDLIFRTGGERRISGLPNSDYAQIHFISSPLPSAKTIDFVYGLIGYSTTTRTFGGNLPK